MDLAGCILQVMDFRLEPSLVSLCVHCVFVSLGHGLKKTILIYLNQTVVQAAGDSLMGEGIVVCSSLSGLHHSTIIKCDEPL